MFGATGTGIPDEAVLRFARSGRAGVLLAWAALSEGTTSAAVTAGLEAVVREAAAIDLGQTQALGACLVGLDAAGVPALVMKGAALSHTCYPAAYLRPRNDDDVLVAEARFEDALRALAALGYRPDVQMDAPLVTRQRHLIRARPWGPHHLDLHWRPLNPVAFDDLPSFDELRAASVPLPAVAAPARGLGPVHAMLLLCAHRVAHHTPTEDPQWLLDLHLAAASLTPADWPRLASLAGRCRLAEVCAFELGRAAEVVGTVVPPEVLARLSRVSGEPSAEHLRTLGPLYVQWLNLRHLPDTGTRLSLLYAHACPPAAYMRSRFGARSPLALPWLYGWRLMTGLGRWARELVRRRVQEGRR